MASYLKMKGSRRLREKSNKSLDACHHGHRRIFLISACYILVAVLIACISVPPQPVVASDSSGDSNTGYECTFYVRSGIGYGVILSCTGNTSSSTSSDVKFTFTYNGSLPDVASRLSIYTYNDSLYVSELSKNPILAVEYCEENPAYYAVKTGATDLCRVFVQESTVTPSGEQYRKVEVCTQNDSGWSSGYYVGQGATVVMQSGGGSGGGNSGQVVTGWNLSQVGNVAIAVAITISSLIPFFIMLPDAAKTLSDNIVANRGRRGDGGDLYLSILSIFVPLLCICVAIITTTAMLSLLHQPIS